MQTYVGLASGLQKLNAGTIPALAIMVADPEDTSLFPQAHEYLVINRDAVGTLCLRDTMAPVGTPEISFCADSLMDIPEPVAQIITSKVGHIDCFGSHILVTPHEPSPAMPVGRFIL